MAKYINEKEKLKKKQTQINPKITIKNETYYQLLISTCKDKVEANICLNHLTKNNVRVRLIEWNGSYMVLINKFGFKQFALREKAIVEELKYKPIFI